MKSTSPAFQFYPKDFLSDSHVIIMPALARGAYITLLCHCWLDGSLPIGMPSLALLAGVSTETFQSEVWPTLEVCFRAKGERFIHPRLDRERKRQRDNRLRRSAWGKQGANKLWATHRQAKAKDSFPSSSSSSSSTPVSTVSSEAESSPPSEPTVLDYPTAGKIKTWPLTETQIGEWRTLYPTLDVLGECRKALAWVQASPERKKTARGMERFLVGWMNRAQDRGGTAAAPTVDPATAKRQADLRRIYGPAQRPG